MDGAELPQVVSFYYSSLPWHRIKSLSVVIGSRLLETEPEMATCISTPVDEVVAQVERLQAWEAPAGSPSL